MNHPTTEFSSELNLFEKGYINDAIISKFEELKHPTAAIEGDTNNPLDFFIEGTENPIRPADCFLHFVLEYVGKCGNRHAYDAASKCVTINNIGHALFKGITTSLQGKQITSTPNYSYTSYFNTRFSLNKACLESYARLRGWSEDDITSEVTLNSTDSIVNLCLKRRRSLANGNRVLDLVITPLVPFFALDKIILPNVSVGVHFERVSNPEFYLMHEALGIGETYRLKIVEATMHIERLVVSPEYAIAVEKILLEDETPVPYMLTNPQIITKNINIGTSNFSANNMFNGSVPEKIVVGFVSAKAFNGARDANPFNFEHCGITEIGLYKNGVPFPFPPTKTDFPNKRVALAYSRTLAALESNNNLGPTLTLEEFINGTTLFAYSLTPETVGKMDIHAQLGATTNVRLEVTFSPALTKEVVAIIYSERQEKVLIDGKRNVTVETVF